MSEQPDQTTQTDPTTQYDQPENTDEQQPHPGLTTTMEDKPDHGEESYRGSGRLSDKRAVITGADSGIGRAVALAFAREGADVVLSYLESEEADADETVQLVEAAGRRAIRCPGDIRDEDVCARIIETALEELGGIDILVNNAAYQMAQQGGIADISTEQFDRVMKTNLYAMFWLSKFAIPHLQPGATIINTSSVQAVSPSPELLDYATTKAGIQNFTKGLAQGLAEKGIRVNAVAPGPIWTPLIPATMPVERAESHGESTPLGRAGQPAEVAPAYVFLASQESSYITAEMIAVTGGQPVT
jgi:NAD(P)-dependent dehydrogenase (short-subunit alcohol dehydrogenase family)